jgi:hypothetical protein
MVGDPHLATDDLHRLAPLLAELAPDQLLPLPVGEPAEARQQRLELRLAGDGLESSFSAGAQACSLGGPSCAGARRARRGRPRLAARRASLAEAEAPLPLAVVRLRDDAARSGLGAP